MRAVVTETIRVIFRRALITCRCCQRGRRMRLTPAAHAPAALNRARTRGAREARTVPQPPLATRGEPGTDDWFPGCGDELARTWSSIDNSSRWDTAPANAALPREALRQLDRAVSALPARQCQVVTMRDIEGMSAE